MSAIPSWAVKGATVVCVDGRWLWNGRPTFMGWFRALLSGDPKKGDVCRIEAVEVCSRGEVWLYLTGYGDTTYEIIGFRPVHTIEDDIATHFASLLDVREPVGV